MFSWCEKQLFFIDNPAFYNHCVRVLAKKSPFVFVYGAIVQNIKCDSQIPSITFNTMVCCSFAILCNQMACSNVRQVAIC